jgi:hypothetical protein
VQIFGSGIPHYCDRKTAVPPPGYAVFIACNCLWHKRSYAKCRQIAKVKKLKHTDGSALSFPPVAKMTVFRAFGTRYGTRTVPLPVRKMLQNAPGITPQRASSNDLSGLIDFWLLP